MFHTTVISEVRSFDIFISVVAGDMGQLAVMDYVTGMKNFDFSRFSSSNLKTTLQLAMFGIGDVWRRYCLVFMSFPFTMFALIGKSVASFFEAVEQLLDKLRTCKQCADLEFSTVILEFLSGLVEKPNTDDAQQLSEHEQKQALYHQVVDDLLTDLATHAPLSADIVECKNGEVQASFNRVKGRSRTVKCAGELSYLKAVRKCHRNLKEMLQPHFLPPNSAKIESNHKRAKKAAARPDTRKMRRLNGSLLHLLFWLG